MSRSVASVPIESNIVCTLQASGSSFPVVVKFLALRLIASLALSSPTLAARLDKIPNALSMNCCTEVGRRANRPFSQTAPGYHDFVLGSALAPRPCFGGGRRIFCDVKPDNGAGHMMEFRRFSVCSEARKNRDCKYPAIPHRSFLCGRATFGAD